MNKIICYIDGSCEPFNPGGKMGIGVIIEMGEERLELSDSCDENENNSNNVAEYWALERVLIHLTLNNIENKEIIIKSDSMLLVKQMKNEWRIKDGLYKEKALLCKRGLWSLGSKNKINMVWIPREQNEYADNLSKL